MASCLPAAQRAVTRQPYDRASPSVSTAIQQLRTNREQQSSARAPQWRLLSLRRQLSSSGWLIHVLLLLEQQFVVLGDRVERPLDRLHGALGILAAHPAFG